MLPFCADPSSVELFACWWTCGLKQYVLLLIRMNCNFCFMSHCLVSLFLIPAPFSLFHFVTDIFFLNLLSSNYQSALMSFIETGSP